MRILASLLPVLFFAGGCARYEFNLIEPADLARHVGSKQDVTVAIDPLHYQLRAVEGHLVMRIHNPTPDRIVLLGDESSVVDPDGESHPLPTQAIMPGSYIKLIFPPIRPRLERTGPSIGFGVGMHAGYRHPRHGPYRTYEHYRHEPRYLVWYDGNSPFYWDWEGESSVRIHLVFERGDDFLPHEFVFQRLKI